MSRVHEKKPVKYHRTCDNCGREFYTSGYTCSWCGFENLSASMAHGLGCLRKVLNKKANPPKGGGPLMEP